MGRALKAVRCAETVRNVVPKKLPNVCASCGREDDWNHQLWRDLLCKWRPEPAEELNFSLLWPAAQHRGDLHELLANPGQRRRLYGVFEVRGAGLCF